MHKNIRILLTIGAILVYGLVIYAYVFTSVIGELFLETFLSSSNKELASHLFDEILYALCFAILMLLISLFLHRPFMKWVLTGALILPLILLTWSFLNIEEALKSETILHVDDRNQRIAYNQAVVPILESLQKQISSLEGSTCSPEEAATIYADCSMPTLYRKSDEVLTSSELDIIETELIKLNDVRKKYPLDQRHFTVLEDGTVGIRVHLMSVTDAKRQSCDDPRDGVETKNEYSCRVSWESVSCTPTQAAYYVGFVSACP